MSNLNKNNQTKLTTDLLVIGSGVAGCTTALEAADSGKQVLVLTSAVDPIDSNSYWAQGGIIYKANNEPNEVNILSADIQRAGAHRCNGDAVAKLASQGPEVVDKFLLGGRASHEAVPFDRDGQGNMSLCLEGSHSRPRILHWSDQTGRAIMENLLRAIVAHPNITLLCNTTAIDLLTSNLSTACTGALIVTDGVVKAVAAAHTVLATGGCGDVYSNTSNPPSARGDGIAMALRAGAQVKDMEFLQFHPTTLYMPGERCFLLTEALRGEGARLRDPVTKKCFAHEYHPDGELAPRDVVSRMIISQMNKTKSNFVYLDITHRGEEYVSNRFPSIFQHCLARGLNMGSDLIPVVPAAHYSCGGVVVDLFGKTSLDRLYAVGEVSCTGLHGANRLASTSLLEGMVWGVAAASSISQDSSALADAGAPECDEAVNDESPPLENSQREVSSNILKMIEMGYNENRYRSPAADRFFFEYEDDLDKLLNDGSLEMKLWMKKKWGLLRKVMWEKVGIVRNRSLMKEAVRQIEVLVNQSEEAFRASIATDLFNLMEQSEASAVEEDCDTACDINGQCSLAQKRNGRESLRSCFQNSSSCPENRDAYWLELMCSIEGFNKLPYERCKVKGATAGQWQHLLGFRNSCVTALAIAKSALNNPISSGAHFLEVEGPVDIIETKQNN